MKPYTNYKDSGVPWIGKIPDGWEIRKIKYLCNVKRGASPRPIDDMKYFDENGERYWVRISDVTTSKKFLEECEEKLSPLGIEASVKINEEDFFVSICASVGKPCISKVKACIHDGFVLFEELPKNLNNYMYYLFETGLLFAGLGKLGTQLNLNSDTIKNIFIPYHANIDKITLFLDHKTSLIDNIISNKEEMLSLLAELRQAIISEAVTKGLDPNAPMKDSGVEWIGEIPVGWVISRIGFETWLRARLGWKGLKADEYVEDGFAFLATPNIKPVNIDFHNVNYITKERYDESPEIKISKGDVLLAKDGSTLGTVNVVRELPKETTVNSSIAVLTPNKNLNSIFLMYLFKSEYMQNLIQRIKGGMGVPHLFQADIVKFQIPLPSIAEQEQIVQYLDEKTSKIDQITADTKEQIKLLKEYRQSLISEVVTGKVEV